MLFDKQNMPIRLFAKILSKDTHMML